jgi:hypothetical protein
MLALVIQYYQSDRDRASDLLRLITDIEPNYAGEERNPNVKLRLVARYDCPHLDLEDIKYAARKFDVSWSRTERHQWDGWPAGPNGMAYDILHTADRWLADCGWSDTDGILLLEPDVVPLSRDWLIALQAEWARALGDGKWCMGSWRNSGGEHGHINGNAIWSREACKHLGAAQKHLAWDCAIAPRFKDHWHITGLIKNCFQSTGATELALRTPEVGDREPRVVHGYKDTSAAEIARRWMNL